MQWGLLVSSVRKLMEKVGDLRDIAILVQSNFGIFDVYWSVLNLVKLSRIIILHFWFWAYICFLKVRKIFFDAYMVGPVFPRSSFLFQFFFHQRNNNFSVFFVLLLIIIFLFSSLVPKRSGGTTSHWRGFCASDQVPLQWYRNWYDFFETQYEWITAIGQHRPYSVRS